MAHSVVRVRRATPGPHQRPADGQFGQGLQERWSCLPEAWQHRGPPSPGTGRPGLQDGKMLDPLTRPAQELCVPGRRLHPLRPQLLLSQMKMLNRISSRNLASQGLVEVRGELEKLLHTAPSWRLAPATIVLKAQVSVGPSVCRPIRPSFHPSIHPPIHFSFFPLKNLYQFLGTPQQMIYCLCPKRKLTNTDKYKTTE